MILTTRPLALIHMDLLGPIRTISLGEKKYGLVIIDDFSYFTRILFLTHKDEVFSAFSKFYKKILNEKNSTIVCICSNHSIEFKNKFFKDFYNEHSIEYNFSISRTP